MKNVKNIALAATTLAAISCNAFAADYSDDIHKNDYQWSQFNLMYAVGEKPSAKDNLKHDYLEMEFGGRSGVVDLYGYVDVFNLLGSDSSDSDKKDGASKMFMKLAPRFSLDGMTGKDLSFGPVQEVYIATLFNWGGGGITGTKDGKAIAGDVNNAFFGLGSDVMVPWLGKVGMNVYGLYDANAKDWNGYQFSMNWFKPFVNFDNGSFISYQGYIDYQFGADTDANHVSSGGVMFNGIYWHSERYSVGYGVKAYNDVYTLENGVAFGGLESSGFAHYFAASYKF
ncbi:outer membrane protein OmpK [Moritella sp. 36]|uniref:nucleoside-specific channel-forming Tsx family protein n=1 Tax=Moritella sp. 36 TaxID=2746233 RepID=UPI001BAA1DC0|nr:outer membrane protein OmpK [Moritella sp. 36]QUM87946.1 outer membrane protein OmpK [Moritella sp. 36]